MSSAIGNTGPAWSPRLTTREIRRLVDIVVAAESAGAPPPLLTGITPGLTVAEARRIRDARLARRVQQGFPLRAAALEPVGGLRLYTLDMVRVAPVAVRLAAGHTRLVQPVLTCDVAGDADDQGDATARPVVHRLGVAIEVLRPLAATRRPGEPDLVACNGAADLLVVDDAGRSDAVVSPGTLRWSVGGRSEPVVPECHPSAAAALAESIKQQLLAELGGPLPRLTLVLGLLAEPAAANPGDTVLAQFDDQSPSGRCTRSVELLLTSPRQPPDPPELYLPAHPHLPARPDSATRPDPATHPDRSAGASPEVTR